MLRIWYTLHLLDKLMYCTESSTYANYGKNYQHNRRGAQRVIQKPTQKHPDKQAGHHGHTQLRYHIKVAQKLALVVFVIVFWHNSPQP